MKFRSSFFFAVLTWSLLLWHAGYRFGTGDQPEFLSYINYLDDQSLYPHDFFLRGLIEKVPNERTVIAYMLLPFVNHLEVACFIFQFLFTVLLVLGLQKLGYVLIKNISVTRIAILLNFLLFFDRGLGNVELYADAFQASSMSAAFVAFGLYYFFKQRYLTATVWMSIASILHPIEGLTVFLVMAASMPVYIFLLRTCSKKVFTKSMLLYFSTAGVFIGLMLYGKIGGTPGFNKSFDQETFFRIYHEFRLSHHYLFKYFPASKKLLFVFFIMINLIWGYNSNKRFFWFNAIALGGIVVYLICTDYLHLIDIANLQFYKITPWIKFFALLIVVKHIYEMFLSVPLIRLSENFRITIYAGFAVLMITLLFLKPEWTEIQNVVHQYGSGWKEKDDIVMISLQIDTQLNKDAVFVQPFSNSDLKYFGRISSWVDWKAFLKNRSQILEWYRRIKIVYGISVNDQEKGFELREKAERCFFNMDEQTVHQLKREGVTHILTFNKHWPFGKLIFENKTYAVYQL